MKYRLTVVCALLGLLVVSPVFAGDGDKTDDEKAVNFPEIVAAVQPSLVNVEYTLQYDKGEEPHGSGLRYRCPSCGNYHGYDDVSTVREERPLEVNGYLLEPTKVVMPDMMFHPRFVKSIAVRYGDKVVSAKPAGYATQQSAQILQLSEPLAGAKPLGEFTKVDPNQDYYAVTRARIKGIWTTSLGAVSKRIVVKNSRMFRPAPSHSLIVDADGKAVAFAMNGELTVDKAGKLADNSPAAWKIISAEEMSANLKAAEAIASKAIVRVALSFRSPTKKNDGFGRYGGRSRQQKTERNVIGMLVKPDEVLVLTLLKPKVTARLQRIIVHTAGGRKVPARFDRSLLDYGAFIAKLETPLDGAVKFAGGKIEDFRNKVLAAADVRLQGENRTDYYSHNRIIDFELGWRSNLYPRLAGGGQMFLFDQPGSLVAFPIARREKTSTAERWSDEEPVLTASSNFAKIFDDLAAATDPVNVPLSEAHENRLAWLGVEMQRLNTELARANKVSDYSRDGQIGAIISYVYPGSPAERAGIEIGDILLRLHIEDQPKPLEVELEYGAYESQSFPWDRLGEVPEQYFDRIPRPWPSAESKITRGLTDIGFGKKFQAELFKNGKIVKIDMTITESPAHHDSAGKFKSESLGLTVKNLTYEVRRYFRKTETDPGVIASKIEPGSKASVSGIKPFEIVTHVNGKEVMNVDDFEKLIAGQQELRFSVKRMDQGRVVKISLKSATTRPATTQPTQPAEAL